MKTDCEKAAGSIILKEYGTFFKQQLQDFHNIIQNGILENNKKYLPIQIVLEPKEIIPIIDLVSSDNKLMTKILGVFSNLCVEVSILRKEAFDRYV